MPRLMLALFIVSFVVVGCRMGGGATGSEPPSQSLAATIPPLATAPATLAASPSPSPDTSPNTDPTPTATRSDLSGIERSDVFWQPLTAGHGHAPEWQTLAEVVDVADLVVRGHVEAVRLGRNVPPAPGLQFALVTVRVTEVFKGIPETRTEGVIEVEYGFYPVDLELLQANIPDGDGLLFLFNMGLEAQRALHPEDFEEYRYQYMGVNVPQGTIRNIDGLARPIYLESSNRFPGTIAGTDFDQLVERVRDSTSRR